MLFVLVPFLGFFTFGPAAAVWLGAGCVLLLAGAFHPVGAGPGHVRAEYISDLLMFALGIVLALATAAVAVREQRARAGWRTPSRRWRSCRRPGAQPLAREIHDSLGHHLTAIGIQLEKAEAFVSLDPAASAQACAHARWSANRALDEGTGLGAHSRPRGGVGAGGPRRTLADLVHHLDGGARRISLDVSGVERRPCWVLYRAAQAGPHQRLPAFRSHRDRRAGPLRTTSARGLCVTDNGSGLGAAEEGFGLAGLRERVPPGRRDAGAVQFGPGHRPHGGVCRGERARGAGGGDRTRPRGRRPGPVREGIAALLGIQPGIEVVGSARDGAQGRGPGRAGVTPTWC
ncbi:histidine kinase [Streptomyces cirratus]